MEAESENKARGRPKFRSPSTRKKLRKILDASKFRVNIGVHEERWTRLKSESGATSHEEFAGLLLDR